MDHPAAKPYTRMQGSGFFYNMKEQIVPADSFDSYVPLDEFKFFEFWSKEDEIKIPDWKHTRPYLPQLTFLTEILLMIADPNYQVDIWAYQIGFRVMWFEECMLTFDTRIEYLKSQIRKKKIKLNKEQIIAILKIHAMCNCFQRNLDPKEIPNDRFESEMYIINHPYWDKIRKQAQHTLYLLRRIFPLSSS